MPPVLGNTVIRAGGLHWVPLAGQSRSVGEPSGHSPGGQARVGLLGQRLCHCGDVGLPHPATPDSWEEARLVATLQPAGVILTWGHVPA